MPAADSPSGSCARSTKSPHSLPTCQRMPAGLLALALQTPTVPASMACRGMTSSSSTRSVTRLLQPLQLMQQLLPALAPRARSSLSSWAVGWASAAARSACWPCCGQSALTRSSLWSRCAGAACVLAGASRGRGEGWGGEYLGEHGTPPAPPGCILSRHAPVLLLLLPLLPLLLLLASDCGSCLRPAPLLAPPRPPPRPTSLSAP